MPLPSPEFEEGKAWDGTTPHTRPNTDIFKRSDGEIAGRHSSEIIALEQLLIDVVSVIELLKNPGAANSILGVKNDQSDLEYKILIQGSGITIAHATESITISANVVGNTFIGTAGEALSVGDVLYIHTDKKAYKAQANTSATSKVVGCSDRDAVLDDVIIILSIGEISNIGWVLTIGDLYYSSSSVAGNITNTPPSANGEYIVPVGIAIDTTRLAIDIHIRVKL